MYYLVKFYNIIKGENKNQTSWWLGIVCNLLRKVQFVCTYINKAATVIGGNQLQYFASYCTILINVLYSLSLFTFIEILDSEIQTRITALFTCFFFNLRFFLMRHNYVMHAKIKFVVSSLTVTCKVVAFFRKLKTRL